MHCKHPMMLTSQGFYVPCGHCRACRISRSREWYTRLYHESLYHEKSTFATLTYDEDHIPRDGNLDKGELQRFFKRLRNMVKVKYYACGEYGDEAGRPHYHAIIYDLGIKDHVVHFEYGKGGKKVVIVDDGPVKFAWDKGRIQLGTVSLYSMRYVTDYIQKKLYGKAAAAQEGRVQPFSLMSKGLGFRFAVDNYEKIFMKGGITINGKEVGIPRYYVKKLELDELVRAQAELEEGEREIIGSVVDRSRRLQHEKKLQAKELLFRKGDL